jgi:hypothetical protein
MKKKIELTKAQENALIWAINMWECSMEGWEYEQDAEEQAQVRGARAAMQRVYQQLDRYEKEEV